MPVTMSAKRALRKDQRRTLTNNTKRSVMKNLLKKSKISKTKESLSMAFSAIDKAAKTHVIHQNKAARLKSRLNKFVKAASAK